MPSYVIDRYLRTLFLLSDRLLSSTKYITTTHRRSTTATCSLVFYMHHSAIVHPISLRYTPIIVIVKPFNDMTHMNIISYHPSSYHQSMLIQRQLGYQFNFNRLFTIGASITSNKLLSNEHFYVAHSISCLGILEYHTFTSWLSRGTCMRCSTSKYHSRPYLVLL